MKRNFVVSVFGSLVGFGMLFILLSAAGIVGARSADVTRSDVARANDVSAATPLTSTFTYQGQLKTSSGSPISAMCDFQFGLWDSASGPAQIGLTQTASSQVSNGLFTVGLNFGANGNVFDGSGRWLQITVRCPAGSGSYTTLNPRQALTPAPYAFALPGLYTQPNATSPNVIGGYSGNFISSTVTGSVIGGGGSIGLENRVQAYYATVSGGYGNTASGSVSTVGGGGTNIASNAGATIGGGQSNTASNYAATIGGGISNIANGHNATVGGGFLNTASGFFSTVAGGSSNTASGTYATVGGAYNWASNYGAAVAGGLYNTASGNGAFVGGGGFISVTLIAGNTAGGNASTIGGGLGNTASGAGSFVGGGGYDGSTYAGNQALAKSATIAGGYGNVVSATAFYGTVGGGGGNTASGNLATIAGGAYNTASGAGSFIGGGGYDGSTYAGNSAAGNASTIGGGAYNTASGNWATVGGGFADTASGGNATVGGGWLNNASNQYATVGGGTGNTASGLYATVSGGLNNTASGNKSFAAGTRAKANHPGTFVWGDSTSADINSSASNQFIVRADGGFAFISSSVDFTPTIGAGVFISTSTGAKLTTAGVWTDVSDRNAKENFVAANGRDVLAKLIAMPVSIWNYKVDDASIHHIGPMAQDFFATFGVGNDNTHLAALDTNGVALAAIQGLYQVMQDKDATIAAQQKQIDDLQTRLSKVEQNTTAGNPAARPEPFNISTLLSVIALIAVGWIGLQQHRSKRGQA